MVQRVMDDTKPSSVAQSGCSDSSWLLCVILLPSGYTEIHLLHKGNRILCGQLSQ